MVIVGLIVGLVLIILSYVNVKFNAIISCLLAIVVILFTLESPEIFPVICAVWTMYRMLPLAAQIAGSSGVEVNTYLIFGTLLEERVDHRTEGFIIGTFVGVIVAAVNTGIAYVALTIQNNTGVFATTIHASILLVIGIVSVVKAFREY